MNTILIILIIAVAILYLKWFFAILFYPFMALSALGSRQSNPKIKKIMRFPLRVAEHFLRFRGQIRALSNFYHPIRTSAYMAV